jgi:hypothetical protein
MDMISTEVERFPIEVSTPRASIMEERVDLKSIFGASSYVSQGY